MPARCDIRLDEIAPEIAEFERSAISFDHGIRAGKEDTRHFQTQCPGCFQINRKLDLGRRLNGQVGRSRTPEDEVDVIGGASEQVNAVHAEG